MSSRSLSYPRTALFSALTVVLTGLTPALAQNAPAIPGVAGQTLTIPVLACSYDGSPVRFTPPNLAAGDDSEGKTVVAEIMKYTGLPQNFDVVIGEVPNAAAMIVLGPDELPRRVIAYNQSFMGQVAKATQNNNWVPISIMAHEIGHHLSGHTLMPGGSQPPLELEADKFSGFVLYKMGAALTDAQKAMSTFASEKDGSTHPGRAKRLSAIQQGWQQACSQQSSSCDGSAVATTRKPAGTDVAKTPDQPAATPASPATPATPPVAATPSTPASPATPATPPAVAKVDAPPVPATPATPPTASTPASAPMPTAGPVVSAPGVLDVIPVPSKDAVPSKFDRFVMDETGLFDPGEKAKLAQAMYDFAKAKEVEVVTLIVKDLHGMSADEYAYAMMRLLRVGKMEMGNGAVLVVAPNQKQVGAALGSGLHLEIDDDRIESLVKGRMISFIESGLESRSEGGPVTAAWSSSVSDAADYIRRDAKNWEWTIRYPQFKDFLQAVADAKAAEEKGATYDPETSLTWRKITRVQGTITSLSGPKEYSREGEAFKKLLAERAPKGGYTTEIKTPDGQILIAYVDAHTQHMMTTQLAEGKPFSFTLRAEMPDDMVFNMLSYDAI